MRTEVVGSVIICGVRPVKLLRPTLALLPLLVGGVTGCAGRAVRPPSPATSVTATEMESTPAPAGERYFMIVYGSQSKPKVPKFTHTWATVVRTNGCPGTVLDHHTISWMPATLDIHPYRFRVEPGANLGMKESLDVRFGFKERISIWGPYEIRVGIYRKFLMQKEFLESGQVGYQCIDTIGEAARTGGGSDCYHALTDSDAKFDRGHYPLSRYGEDASESIVEQLQTRQALYEPWIAHDWLLPALGIDQYPVIRRTYRGRVDPAVRTRAIEP